MPSVCYSKLLELSCSYISMLFTIDAVHRLQRALIDSVPTVIMHSAMVAMVHPPHGGAAPTPSCLVGPRCTEILPFLASNSKKKWSFSELRTFFPKNLSYRRVDFLRNLRSRGKLQSFLRVGLYCKQTGDFRSCPCCSPG